MPITMRSSPLTIEASEALSPPATAAAMSIGNVDLFPLAIRFVLIVAFFGNAIDLEATNVTSGVEIGFNYMAVLKAAFVMAAGILGGIGWVRAKSVRILFGTSAGILACLLLALYVVTIPLSIYRPVSMVATIALTSYLLFVVTALVFLGSKQVVKDMLLSLFLYVCVAWVAALVVPSVGILNEYAGSQGEIRRMTGLAHPNTLGGMSALFLGMLVANFRKDQHSWLVYFAVGILGAATLAGSLSRTAMIACVVSIAFTYRRWFLHRKIVYVLIPACVVGCASLVYIENRFGFDRALEKVLVKLSKTEDADEITSATGRTEIWAYALKLIGERPWFGYGANTSPLLMEHHSFQTHNIVLNPTLCFGIGGGVIMLCWLCLNLYWAFVSEDPIVSVVGIYIIVSGFTEDTILSTFPEATTIAWLAISFIPYLDFAKRQAIAQAATETG